jgi:hypothetical protein
MNKPTEPIKVNVGTTCVRVMRVNINEQTKQTKIVTIHEGIVVQDNGSFVRVFNPAPRDKGGDLNPETSELFPLLSARCWCEKTAERSTPFPIPPALRFKV